MLGHEWIHVVLVGPGGIGKSSLTETILNDPVIEAKFKARRFFIRFSDLLSSQIYNIFVECTLIAHDFSCLSADDELEAVVSACEAFIRTLRCSTCRSTSLRPVIDGLDTSLSNSEEARAAVLYYTPRSVLANRQSDFANALQLYQLQYNLAVELEWKETAFEAIQWSAEYYRLSGQCGTAQTILDQAIASPDWATADERTRAHFVFIRAGRMDEARQPLKNAQRRGYY